MTATPIPRTLALSVHGDMDLTIIDELPKGRKPIKTALCNSKKQIYNLLRREVDAGRQAESFGIKYNNHRSVTNIYSYFNDGC